MDTALPRNDRAPSRSPAAQFTGLLIAFLLLGACTPASEPLFEQRLVTFGTLVDVSLWGVDAELAEQAFRTLERDFTYMNDAWHAWRPGTLGRFNELCQTGIEFTGDPSTLPLLRLATELSERSENLFNPAIGRLVALWGFHADLPEPQTPPANQLAALVAAQPRMSDIRIDGIRVHCTNPMVKVDLGGFAKGFGVDRAIERLREMDIENAIVNAGGDLRAIGRRGERAWRIGIRHPRRPGAIAFLDLSDDESVFTSGDYERYYEVSGRRYHHIIDPRTGYPADGSQSVTVIHGNATEADAAATALFVAGPERWPQIAARLGIDRVMLIDSAGVIHMTPSMQERVTLTDNPPPSVKVTATP